MAISILGNLGLSESSVIHKVINNTFIIEFGIIKEVQENGIVTVEMSVAKSKEDIIITNCILVSPCSSSVSINIEPKIDDKVVVLFPKKFHIDMFNKKHSEPIISEYVSGYQLFGGIALLMNQFNEEEQKNIVNFSEGKLEVKLAYSEDKKDNLLVLTTSDSGELSLKSNNTKINISDNSEINIDTGKTTINIDSNGNVSIDTNGKYSIKNKITDLKEVIDGLADEITNLTVISEAGALPVNPTSITSIELWKTKLNSLLD